MTTPKLGRLQRVPLRKAWKREDTGFTPWLAEASNIALLGETIGVDLEVEQVEANVGPFRADVVCRDPHGDVVLIENQLERTDHNHLGQILTYAAGLKAKTVVWVAARFTEEHRAAIDWLNDNTGDDLHFFGLEIELWRIGDSDYAPKFNAVAKPNEWSKAVKESADGGGVSPAQERYISFWKVFAQRADARNARYSVPEVNKANWSPWGIGGKGASLAAAVAPTRGTARVFINILSGPTRDVVYDALKDARATIEADLGTTLDWREAGKERNIVWEREVPLDDEAQWAQAADWLLDSLAAMEAVFRPRILAIEV